MTRRKVLYGSECKQMNLSDTQATIQPDQLNGAALAYLGDAVFELAVRNYILKQGKTAPNRLHKAAIKFVSAQAQAKIIQFWLTESNGLTADELTIYKRGRNHKANTRAKNASIGDYRQATGFEALIGWLHLSGQEDRLQELITQAIRLIEEEQVHV